MNIIEVSDLDMAFGGKAMQILPPMTEIPDEFKHSYGNKWVKFVTDAFYHGIASHTAKPKEGVDPAAVWRMFRACIGSFEPKHEHKTAGCAYMLSCFFEDIELVKG